MIVKNVQKTKEKIIEKINLFFNNDKFKEINDESFGLFKNEMNNIFMLTPESDFHSAIASLSTTNKNFNSFLFYYKIDCYQTSDESIIEFRKNQKMSIIDEFLSGNKAKKEYIFEILISPKMINYFNFFVKQINSRGLLSELTEIVENHKLNSAKKLANKIIKNTISQENIDKISDDLQENIDKMSDKEFSEYLNKYSKNIREDLNITDEDLKELTSLTAEEYALNAENISKFDNLLWSDIITKSSEQQKYIKNTKDSLDNEKEDYDLSNKYDKLQWSDIIKKSSKYQNDLKDVRNSLNKNNLENTQTSKLTIENGKITYTNPNMFDNQQLNINTNGMFIGNHSSLENLYKLNDLYNENKNLKNSIDKLNEICLLNILDNSLIDKKQFSKEIDNFLLNKADDHNYFIKNKLMTHIDLISDNLIKEKVVEKIKNNILSKNINDQDVYEHFLNIINFSHELIRLLDEEDYVYIQNKFVQAIESKVNLNEDNAPEFIRLVYFYEAFFTPIKNKNKVYEAYQLFINSIKKISFENYRKRKFSDIIHSLNSINIDTSYLLFIKPKNIEVFEDFIAYTIYHEYNLNKYQKDSLLDFQTFMETFSDNGFESEKEAEKHYTEVMNRLLKSDKSLVQEFAEKQLETIKSKNNKEVIKMNKESSIDWIKRNAEEGVYQGLATVTVDNLAKILIATFKKSGMRDTSVEDFEKFLNTNLGKAALSALVSAGVHFAPPEQISKNEKIQKVADKCMENAAATGVVEIGQIASDFVIPAIMQAISPIANSSMTATQLLSSAGVKIRVEDKKEELKEQVDITEEDVELIQKSESNQKMTK